MSAAQIWIGMTTIEVRFWITILKESFVAKLPSKDSLSIRPSSSIHGVKGHLEVRPIHQFLNGTEIELFLHHFHIELNIFNHLDRKDRLSRSIHICEVILSYLGQIDILEKSVVSSGKLSDSCSFLVHKVGELLLGWSSVS